MPKHEKQADTSCALPLLLWWDMMSKPVSPYIVDQTIWVLKKRILWRVRCRLGQHRKMLFFHKGTRKLSLICSDCEKILD